MKISLQKYFDPNNYLDREYGKIQAQKPNNTPNFVPYYNGVRNNYNELQTDWEQLNLLKVGEEITEDDKKKLIEAYQNAVIEKLKTDDMNVRNGSDIATILRIINKRDDINPLVEEMQKYLKEKQINADRYKGKLTMKDGKLELTHNSSFVRPQTNIFVNFPITHTEIIENLKIEKRAEIISKKQLENFQAEIQNKNTTENNTKTQNTQKTESINTSARVVENAENAQSQNSETATQKTTEQKQEQKQVAMPEKETKKSGEKEKTLYVTPE